MNQIMSYFMSNREALAFLRLKTVYFYNELPVIFRLYQPGYINWQCRNNDFQT